MTYKVTIKSFPDSDIQPFIASLEHADVQEVAAIGADRVLVTLQPRANAYRYERFMDADPDVLNWVEEVQP